MEMVKASQQDICNISIFTFHQFQCSSESKRESEQISPAKKHFIIVLQKQKQCQKPIKVRFLVEDPASMMECCHFLLCCFLYLQSNEELLLCQEQYHCKIRSRPMKKSFYSFSLELALSLSSNEVVVVTFHQEYIQSYIQDT